MRLDALGRHLHIQIVVPLLAASIAVASVATFVGVGEMSKIVGTWVEGNVDQTMENVQSRLEAEKGVLSTHAALIAGEVRFEITEIAAERNGLPAGANALAAPASGAQSWQALVRTRVEPHLTGLSSAMPSEAVMVMDGEGRVVASNGVIPVKPGEKPLAEYTDHLKQPGTDVQMLTKVNGTSTLSASKRFAGPDGKNWAVIVSKQVDSTLLGSALSGLGPAFAYFDDNGRFVADYVDMTKVSPAQAAKLEVALRASDPRVAAALRSQGGSPSDFALADSPYRVLVRPVRFSGSPDPPSNVGHFVAAVNTQVQDAVGAATVRLISFWSVLAVVLLTAFGLFVAQRVSEQVVTLADSARLVAEGDFTHKVPVTGTNEVAQLAESFNQMTDSLRQRTEGVTKKVLELATLYEMSRALGSTLDLDTLLDSVLDSALRIFNVESGYVVLRDRSSERLEIRAWRGSTGSRPDERALRNSMSEWVAREGRPLIFNPPAEGEAGGQVDSVTGANAALCVPLVSNEGVIGAVVVGSRDPVFRFTSDDVRLLSTIANHATIAIGNIELFSSLQDAYIATVRSLAAAVDAKDPFTRGHSDRVAEYAMAIAERLELSGDQRTALEMAAYLHDIGKIGIREEILLKPGRLDDEEMEQMRHHPLIGANILKPVAFPWAIAPIVRHHHEHWDGCGYPAGLRGEEIPLLARILSVADAFEAMTSDRPYRRGRDREEAIEELKRCAGHQFDPRVIEAFVAELREERDDGPEAVRRLIEEIQPDESRAIFVAICDGMLASFRRLGGPRLSSNLENELNRYFAAEDLPFTFSGGRLTGKWDDADDREAELDGMRRALTTIANSMSRTSGRSLVDGFYTEAVSGLSDRMRHLAEVLDLYRKP